MAQSPRPRPAATVSAFLTFIVSCFTCMIVSLPVIFREHYMHAKAVTVTIVLLYYTFITQHTCHIKLHGPTDNSPPFGVFFTGVVWWTKKILYFGCIQHLSHKQVGPVIPDTSSWWTPCLFFVHYPQTFVLQKLEELW
jgi:hypothetical protein